MLETGGALAFITAGVALGIWLAIFVVKEIGFKSVASSPMVRSSYKAGSLVQKKIREQQELANS